MKNLIYACFIVLASSSSCFADLAFIPLHELTKDSDLIVIGTLTEISESGDTEIHGKGFIVIDEVIAGSVKTSKGFPIKPGDRLLLEYIENFTCVYGSHKRIENEKGVFLLTINEQAEIKYDTFRSLDTLPEIKRLLRKGIGPNKTAKSIKTENEIEEASSPELPENQNIESNICVRNSREFAAREYYPIRALLVILFSMMLYRVLYRSRFKS